jgi:hypothetical protein
MRSIALAILTVSILLGSCNAVSDMKGAFEKQELVQKLLRKNMAFSPKSAGT